MTGTVCTVLADVIFGVVFLRNCIAVCIIRHSLMECGIKDTNVRNILENLAGCSDTLQVGRIVQRGKRNTFFNTSLNRIVNQGRLAVQITARHDTVAYSNQRIQQIIMAGKNGIYNKIDCFFVISTGAEILLGFLFTFKSPVDSCIRKSQRFCKTANENLA